MAKLIFVNLPVADLPASVAFYEAIGATRNPQFSDDTAACMVLSDVIHVMLLTHEKRRQFLSKAIPDSKTTAQVILCISEDSREGVGRIVEAAVTAGGRGDLGPVDDRGFMYGRSFEDLDGHVWAPMWMDMAAAATAMAKG